MGRRVTVGIVPGGIGGIAINDATIVTADTNANLTLRPDGSGEILSHSHMRVLNNQSIKFYETEGNGSNFVGLQSPASVASDVTFALPGADGSDGQVIKTDGSGNLTFTDAGLAVTDDTATNTNYYPAFIDQTSGSETGLRVSSSKLTFNPSTGTLAATAFSGDGSGLSNVVAATMALVATNTTNAAHYPVFVDTATGNENPRTDTGFTYNPSSGELTAVILTASSDAAGKKDIETIDNALDKIKNLRGVSYLRKENNSEEIGVIAQEVEKVLPSLVRGKEGNKSVAYGNIVAVLIEAIKEQQEQIENLTRRLA